MAINILNCLYFLISIHMARGNGSTMGHAIESKNFFKMSNLMIDTDVECTVRMNRVQIGQTKFPQFHCWKTPKSSSIALSLISIMTGIGWHLCIWKLRSVEFIRTMPDCIQSTVRTALPDNPLAQNYCSTACLETGTLSMRRSAQ